MGQYTATYIQRDSNKDKLSHPLTFSTNRRKLLKLSFYFLNLTVAEDFCENKFNLNTNRLLLVFLHLKAIK